MNEFNRANIDTSRRLRRDQQVELTAQFAGDDDLLLVSATEFLGESHLRRGPNVILVDEFRGDALAIGKVDAETLGKGRAVRAVNHKVFGDCEVPDESVLGSVFGDVPDTGVDYLAHAGVGNVHRAKVNRPCARGLKANESLGQFGLTVTLNAGNRQYLARVNLERNVVDDLVVPIADHRESCDRKPGITAFRCSFGDRQVNRATDHHRREGCCGVRRFRFADNSTESDHRDAVRDGLDFAQFVGDKHDGGARFRKTLHDSHEFIGFLRSQHRGGLIKNENPCIAREGLDNLDSLLSANREIFDEGVGVNFKTKSIRNLADTFACSVEVECVEDSGGLMTKHHVLCDSEDGNQHEVLVNHPDPSRHCVAGPFELLNDTVKNDVSFFGRVETVQDVHERRFTRSVFTQKRMNLARVDHEINVVVGDERSESFGDSAEFEFHLFILEENGTGAAETVSRRPPTLACYRLTERADRPVDNAGLKLCQLGLNVCLCGCTGVVGDCRKCRSTVLERSEVNVTREGSAVNRDLLDDVEHGKGHALLGRGEHPFCVLRRGSGDVLVDADHASVNAGFDDCFGNCTELVATDGEEDVSAGFNLASSDRLRGSRVGDEVTDEVTGLGCGVPANNGDIRCVVSSPRHGSVVVAGHEVGNGRNLHSTVGTNDLGRRLCSREVAGEVRRLVHGVVDRLEVRCTVRPSVNRDEVHLGVCLSSNVDCVDKVESDGDRDVAALVNHGLKVRSEVIGGCRFGVRDFNSELSLRLFETFIYRLVERLVVPRAFVRNGASQVVDWLDGSSAFGGCCGTTGQDDRGCARKCEPSPGTRCDVLHRVIPLIGWCGPSPEDPERAPRLPTSY